MSKTRRHGGAEPEAAGSAADAVPADHAPAACGCAGAGLPLLKEHAADANEVLAICLLRFVFAGYCSGKIECWDRAYGVAAEVLGHDGGAIFMGRVLPLARAVKAEKPGSFAFLPGDCCRISEDESELLGLIQSARAGHRCQVEQAMLMFAGGGEAERLSSALKALGALLGMMAGPGTAAAGVAETGRPRGARLH
jgi:hypothetical protein